MRCWYRDSRTTGCGGGQESSPPPDVHAAMAARRARVVRARARAAPAGSAGIGASGAGSRAGAAPEEAFEVAGTWGVGEGAAGDPRTAAGVGAAGAVGAAGPSAMEPHPEAVTSATARALARAVQRNPFMAIHCGAVGGRRPGGAAPVRPGLGGEAPHRSDECGLDVPLGG